MTHKPVAPVPSRNEVLSGKMISAVWERWLDSIRRRSSDDRVFAATLDPDSVAANTSVEQTFTVAGLKVDMIVQVNKPTLTAGLVIGNVRVSAADTLAIQFGNLTGSAIDPPSESYRVWWR